MVTLGYRSRLFLFLFRPRLSGAVFRLTALIWCVAASLGCGDENQSSQEKERIELVYWEKWTGIEGDAMQRIVERFNASQDRILVRYEYVTDLRTRLLLATAGGNPPDVAGLFPDMMIKYSERGALMPLNQMMERDGLSRERYLPSIISLCEYREFYWGLPTTPAATALHYNRRLFKEAGLDPDDPPRTIEELDEYTARMTEYSETGRIRQLGFTPMDPFWFKAWYGWWFGGEHWNGEDTITLTTDEWIACLRWIRSFPEDFNLESLQRFQAGSGQFGSEQNLFFAERLAMQHQGVWMANFIEEYNSDMEWAAAPFPAVSEEMTDVTFVDTDMLVIPKGTAHPREAWEFIKFVQEQENLESLCLWQKKFSPLREVSERFYQEHDNPFVIMFRRLAESPNAHGVPMMPIVDELREELYLAVDKVWLRIDTPEQALIEAEEKLQQSLDRRLRQWNRVKGKRMEEWAHAWDGHL